MPVIQLPNTSQGTKIPKGIIKIWAGILSSIPSGWSLCDGLLGRPNLLGRFVKGIQTNATPPGLLGGVSTITLTVSETASHTHTANMASANPSFGAFGVGYHAHTIPLGTLNGTTGVKVGTGKDGGNGLSIGDNSPPITTGTGFTGSAGSGLSHNNIPPYYEVAYIIKTTDN